jgi:hypothetical protein
MQRMSLGERSRHQAKAVSRGHSATKPARCGRESGGVSGDHHARLVAHDREASVGCLLSGKVRGTESSESPSALITEHTWTRQTHSRECGRADLAAVHVVVLELGVDLSYAAIHRAVAECLQAPVHLERRPGRRVVTELARVRVYHPARNAYELESR